MFISHSTEKNRGGKTPKNLRGKKIYIWENNLIIDFIGLAKVMAPFLTVTILHSKTFVSNDSLVHSLDYTRMTTTFRFI